MRTIPATMATQHPDNARAPFWDASADPFISVQKEITECAVSFAELGVSEFMWDWEGKHADAAVIDKLFTDYHDYFAQNRLSRDKFLTFRLPNIWEEKGYSLLQAMTVILTSEDFARDLGFADRPLFEVILPMTETADQLMHMHKLFQQLADFKSREFTPDQRANTSYLEVIPLVESVESQHNIGKLLTNYTELHKRHFGRPPAYIRPFLARSDPALVSGMLATVLANKIALSRIYEFGERAQIPVFPISGVGSLPFRGGLTPETVDAYVAEYPGIRTVSLQSSFRYDHPAAKVKSAVIKLEHSLPESQPHLIGRNKQEELIAISHESARHYQATLGSVLGDLKSVFSAVPRRRERRQHTGLLAYGRKAGNQRLPRAITFTATLYSIGIPPELIGLGRTLRKLNTDQLDLVRQHYHSLDSDLVRAGRYLNSQNLAILARRNPAWKQVQDDIAATESVLGVRLHPRSHNDIAHKNLTSNVLLLKNNPKAVEQVINETALLRKSLG